MYHIWDFLEILSVASKQSKPDTTQYYGKIIVMLCYVSLLLKTQHLFLGIVLPVTELRCPSFRLWLVFPNLVGVCKWVIGYFNFYMQTLKGYVVVKVTECTKYTIPSFKSNQYLRKPSFRGPGTSHTEVYSEVWKALKILLKSVNYLYKRLHLKYLTGSYIHLWDPWKQLV